MEEKNLVYQNFTEADLGENKARVVAERYSNVFGLETSYVPDFIESAKQVAVSITAAGFFEKFWAKDQEKYDELEGIGWKWQSVDGCMAKEPLAQESVRKNTAACGKNGHKTLDSYR